ncbi:MAG: T9SS type A sorting domain-containing protein [Flavobacteriales bacterium]
MQAQVPPSEEWQACYGGSSAEVPYAMVRMADGDLCVAGQTSTMGTSGDVSGNHGIYDGWVIKLDDVDGSLIWQHCLGGSVGENIYAAVATPDGGVIVGGESGSTDDDVLGCAAGTKHWLLKLDSAGVVQWHSCGTNGHTPWAIALTSDGGCITTGRTWGVADLTVDKFDSAGNLQWSESFGGSESDMGKGIVQTADQGYLVSGWTLSNDGDVTGNHGSTDFWLLKLDSVGVLQWQRCLGGSEHEVNNGLVQASNGNHLVYGYTASNDGDVSGLVGTHSMWAAMVDVIGDIVWQQCHGPDTAISQSSSCDRVIVQPDGFICAVSMLGIPGVPWLFKMDLTGAIQWQSFYGNYSLNVTGLCATNDGGLAWSCQGSPSYPACTGLGNNANFLTMKLGWPHEPQSNNSAQPDAPEVTIHVANGMLHVSTTSLQNWNTMEIIDANGRIVLQDAFLYAGHSTGIGHLAHGVYVVRLVGNTDARSLRFALY